MRPIAAPPRVLAGAVAVATLALVAPATRGTIASAAPARSVRVVSSRLPLVGPGRELGAVRSASLQGRRRAARLSPTAEPWRLLATIPGAVLRDVSFPTPKVGYAVAELGQVWKTTDGGTTWTEVLNLGFPYYWYGVDALDADNVAISGFDNSNFTGLVRWSHDGGATWSADLVITTDGWANRVRFATDDAGLVGSIVSLDSANEAQYTNNGGQTQQDWTTVVPDPSGGWFGADFTFLPDLTAYLSGITECTSPDGGANWTCGPSVDPVFDGAVEYRGRRYGWVGGGEISPSVEGWVHVTTDGGATWSGRTLDGPWPIRDILFLNRQVGWAAGGNVFSGVGGMYLSTDGGQTWSLDADTGAEMSSCASLRYGPKAQVWCVGTTGSFSGVVYSVRLALRSAASASSSPTALLR